MQNEYVLVLTTVASEEDAADLARGIVEARLAACVHIDVIRSIYRWKGEVHNEPEWRLNIKTTAVHYAQLERFIKAHHGYETPEIVRIEIAAGSQEYLAWIRDSVT